MRGGSRSGGADRGSGGGGGEGNVARADGVAIAGATHTVVATRLGGGLGVHFVPNTAGRVGF